MTKEKTITVSKDGWHRLGVSLKPEARPKLDRLVELSGARSLSAMVAALAEDPESTAVLLAPIVAATQARRDAADPQRARKKQLDKVTQLIRDGKVNPDELARVLAHIQAQKA